MKINIEEAIKFFDDTPDGGGLASSIVGLIGEDLNAWAFKHFMESENKAEVKILTDIVTTGSKKGKRLDRWIYVKEKSKETLYQCEIKNWSSTAIGGRRLKLDADLINKQQVAQYYWNHQLTTELMDNNFPGIVTKVLLDNMIVPDRYNKVEVNPLVIYWMPISNTDQLNPYFKVPVSTINNSKIRTKFKDLNIFSVSLYLRGLLEKSNKKELIIDLPNVKNRLDALNKIIS
jgi:hypothetical protein